MYYVDEDMWELYVGIGICYFAFRVTRFAIVLEYVNTFLTECVCNTAYLYKISLYRGTSRDDYRSLSLFVSRDAIVMRSYASFRFFGYR